MPKSKPYTSGLRDRLRDPGYAAAYLNAAHQESQEVFLLALRDVAEAHKISKVATGARVNRETLYRTLSPRGNPTLTTYNSLLNELGVDVFFIAKKKRGPRSTASPTGTTGPTYKGSNTTSADI